MDPGENSSQSAFRHFMRLIVALEEVQIQGAKYMQSLASELEAFRRPPLTQSSPLLAKIFKEYPTSRLQSYVESGCCHMAAETARCQKLDAAFRNLDTHRLNVDELVGELREVCHSAEAALSSSIDVTPEAYLREDGNEDVFSETSPGSMPTGYLPCRRTEWIPNGNTSADHESDSSCGTEEEDSDGQSSPISGVEDKVCMSDREISDWDYWCMMSCQLSMVEEEVAMQNQVHKSLTLKTESEHLQSFCLLWELRPFVDERVINKALRWL